MEVKFFSLRDLQNFIQNNKNYELTYLNVTRKERKNILGHTCYDYIVYADFEEIEV